MLTTFPIASRPISSTGEFGELVPELVSSKFSELLNNPDKERIYLVEVSLGNPILSENLAPYGDFSQGWQFGKINGTLTWHEEGPFNYAPYFNGSSSIDYHRDLGGIIAANKTFAIEFWIKTSFTPAQTPISINFNSPSSQTEQTGVDIYISGRRLSFHIVYSMPDNALKVTTDELGANYIDVVDNNWHHISVSYNGNKATSGVSIYVDGILQPKKAGLDSSGIAYTFSTLNSNLNDVTYSTAPMRIGGRCINGWDLRWPFTGFISEVRLWAGTRSLNAVNTSKDVRLASNTNGLSVLFPLDDGPNYSNIINRSETFYKFITQNATLSTDINHVPEGKESVLLNRFITHTSNMLQLSPWATIPVDIRYPHYIEIRMKRTTPTIYGARLRCISKSKNISNTARYETGRVGIWDPNRNTTLAREVLINDTSVYINRPNIDWIDNITNVNARILFDVPTGSDADDPRNSANESAGFSFGSPESYSNVGFSDLNISGTFTNYVVFDNQGNFITTTGTTVRKYSPSGALLWSQNHGSNLNKVAVDSSNNVFVCGVSATGPFTVRKYSPTGALLNSVYTGTGTNAQAIAVDSSGNVFVGCNKSVDSVSLLKFTNNLTLIQSVDAGVQVNSIAITEFDEVIIGATSGDGNTIRRYLNDLSSYTSPTFTTSVNVVKYKNGLIYCGSSNTGGSGLRIYNNSNLSLVSSIPLNNTVLGLDVDSIGNIYVANSTNVDNTRARVYNPDYTLKELLPNTVVQPRSIAKSPLNDTIIVTSTTDTNPIIMLRADILELKMSELPLNSYPADTVVSLTTATGEVIQPAAWNNVTNTDYVTYSAIIGNGWNDLGSITSISSTNTIWRRGTHYVAFDVWTNSGQMNTGDIFVEYVKIHRLTNSLKLSNINYSSPTDNYLPRLNDPYSFDTRLFEDNYLTGSSRFSYGNLTISNYDGALDPYLAADWDTATIEVKLGANDFLYDDFGTIFTGTAEQATWDEKSINIRLRSSRAVLDRPIQLVEYLGTGGIEGGEDIKGQPKPLLYGKCLNVTPIYLGLNAQLKPVFQVHDGQVNSIISVYFNGNLATLGVDYSVNNSLGTIIIEGAVGQEITSLNVTADVEGAVSIGQSGYISSTADIIREILVTKADFIWPDDFNTASFAQLNLDAPASIGIYIDSQESISSVIDKVCTSIGSYWSFDRLDNVFLGRIVEPNISTEISLTDKDIIKIQRITTPMKCWKVSNLNQKNWTVLDKANLAEILLEPGYSSILERMTSEGRKESVDNISIKTPLALEREIESLFSSSEDAILELERQFNLFSVHRDIYEVTIKHLKFNIDLGDSVLVSYPRFNLNNGKSFIVIGYKESVGVDTMVLILWG